MSIDDQSIQREPDGRAERASASDPSEARASKRLATEYGDGSSVYDEPAMFPHQDGRPITRDWTCSQCGYNLRGLVTGARCPECGHIELYHPPPQEVASYGQWLDYQCANVRLAGRVAALALAGVAAAPVAVLAALLTAPPAPWINTLVFAPCLEEMLKIAALSWLVSNKPQLIRHDRNILVIAAVSALTFAALENVIYLKLYMKGPAPDIVAARWIGGSAVHIAGSVIAARGLVLVWRRTMREKRPPRLRLAYPYLVAAIVLHGAYNLTVSTLPLRGLLL